ncbi:MAG: hypothetical protein ACI4J5_02420 [Oscillospiraceae bacterium]
MIRLKKIIAAAASAVLVLILMCGCESSSETVEYERLKAEIVGMWIDEDGPAVDTENRYFGKSLRFYEFTSNGEVYYHYVFISEDNGMPTDGSIQTSTYYLDKNMLVNVTGSEEEGDLQKTGAYIEINGNTMTMSNNSGSTNYTKLSVEDATGYYVYYKDENLYNKQQELINGPAADGAEVSAENDGSGTEASEEAVSENAAE